jgi:hypothetical protein
MAHGLTSEPEMVQDFLLIQEEIQIRMVMPVPECRLAPKLNG